MPRYIPHPRPKLPHVIAPQRRDDSHHGAGHEIRRVVLATVRDEDAELEVARSFALRFALGCGDEETVPDFEEVARKDGGGDGGPADADAFLGDEEVGGGVHPYALGPAGRGAVGEEESLDVGACAAFTLCAGDVDDIQGCYVGGLYFRI
ncbi:hypothetical protein V493_07616, partial [Pseudogymnoascus sp. VKM F-4281 (FW-2241)]